MSEQVAFSWVAAAGALAGALALLVFHLTTDSTRLREAANLVVAHLFEIRLFSQEPRLVLQAQRDLIAANGRALVLLARPSLILLLPFALLFAGLDSFFGHAPLRPGEAALVTVQWKNVPQSARLEGPNGIDVDTPPVYAAADRQMIWRVRANGAAAGELRVTSGSASAAKWIAAGNGFAWTPARAWVFSGGAIEWVEIAYRQAAIFHLPWLVWFCLFSFLGAAVFSRSGLILLLLLGCACSPRSQPKAIILGVDGMDPAFVERHWDALPNLRALREHGHFGRLRTTSPPQSPVAWSSFITGLAPDEHGIFDFVHRDPKTLRLFSSMAKTDEPKFVLPLGPYLLPLSPARASVLRHGTPFWRILSDRGVPVLVQHMPINYPPEEDAGRGLSGMGTPDLLGTLGTFTFFTDDPLESARAVPGGRIVPANITNGRALLVLEGPANPLRKDHAATSALLTIDVDAVNSAARLKLGDQTVLLRQGEWSGWLKCEFELIPHVSSVHGMVRVFAKELHPGLGIYVSPINFDPAAPALPISAPPRWAEEMESAVGPYSTLGIPEDTSALRQQVLSFEEFQQQSQFVFSEEAKLLDYSLSRFTGGLLFFYFSSVDQSSHILWGRYEDKLLQVYRALDERVGEVRRKEPDAHLTILSDHGFTTFERAVHLNAWLRENALLRSAGGAGQPAEFAEIDWPSTKAYAVGLNGLYLNLKGREKFGTVEPGAPAKALLDRLREQLLAWRDPLNGRAIVQEVTTPHPSARNRAVAPDLIVGYAAGYRASWQTALGETPEGVLEDNNDAWIGDHCVAADVVPGVFFSDETSAASPPRLMDLTASILRRFGVQKK